MSILEEKIRKNKELFDKAEPGKDHEEKFTGKLKALHEGEKEPKPRKSSRMWKVAAILVLLMGISAILVFTIPEKSVTSVSASELPKELREAKLYYNDEADKKLELIEQCASTSEEAAMVMNMAIEEMEALEQESADLESQLQNNIDNQRVKDALIVNYRTKSKLLDNILYRLCNI